LIKFGFYILFLFLISTIVYSVPKDSLRAGKKLINSSLFLSDSEKKLEGICIKAKKENWKALTVGERIVKIGLEFVGTPYIGGTLDSTTNEICRVDLKHLDCVTFFENVLAISKAVSNEKCNIKDIIANVTFTRYRFGKLNGYISRLHYTSDWISDNVQKHIVNDVTKDIGGEILNLKVGFMSQNPKYYEALKKDSTLIPKIKKIEDQINSRKHYFIPKDKVKSIEKKIKSGDIIAIVMNDKGLDYAHTGLAYLDEKGTLRFLHASSQKKKVLIDESLSDYLMSVKKDLGITVLRPL
jgi:hypothetical protein